MRWSLKIVMENPNHLNEPNEAIPEVNLVVPEPNQVADIHDPNEMVDIPDDIDLVDYDDEDPEEDPKEEPEPNNRHGNQFAQHPNPQQPGNMNGWLEEDDVNENVNNEDIKDEDVEIEVDDDAELIFPYEVEGDQTPPPRDESSDFEPPNAELIGCKRRNDCTAMSSAEAEYVALSASCAQVMWMRTQLQDYGFKYNKIPLYCDSQSAIEYHATLCSHLSYLTIPYSNGYQLADMFTKSLPEKVSVISSDELVHKLLTRVLRIILVIVPENIEWILVLLSPMKMEILLEPTSNKLLVVKVILGSDKLTMEELMGLLLAYPCDKLEL
ncbi:hypothetical protein Tco_0462434 [Tanacetum coccineum]